MGLIAAIALAQSFDNVISLGVLPEGSDKRTTALMVPAIKFLEKIGLWESIEPHAAPIATMRILDGTNRLIRSPAVTFEASEIDEAGVRLQYSQCHFDVSPKRCAEKFESEARCCLGHSLSPD